jgi:hypothetical protein
MKTLSRTRQTLLYCHSTIGALIVVFQGYSTGMPLLHRMYIRARFQHALQFAPTPYPTLTLNLIEEAYELN